MSKANELDQYYTRNDLADAYTRQAIDRFGSHRVYLEPSAGTGAFLKELKGLQFEAYDLEPKAHGIIEGDFLCQLLPRQNYITIGNPPFILDVEFFNKCAEHSDAVCFIIPRSWRKASVINRLNTDFHLIHDEDCPKDSFILHGDAHDVSTCWQIWERRDVKREKIVFKGDFFTVVKPHEEHDIVLRCYGSRSGEVLPDDYSGNETTVRRLRSKIPNLKQIISSIDWSVRKSNVSSVPTINPIEIELEVRERMNNVKET